MNWSVGFTIPLRVNGEEKKNMSRIYVIRFDDGHPDPLNLIVEVSRRSDAKNVKRPRKNQSSYPPVISGSPQSIMTGPPLAVGGFH